MNEEVVTDAERQQIYDEVRAQARELTPEQVHDWEGQLEGVGMTHEEAQQYAEGMEADMSAERGDVEAER
jgi:hypothetical protein